MNNLICQLLGARDGKKLGLSWDHMFSIPTHPNWGCSKLLPDDCRTAPATPGLLKIVIKKDICIQGVSKKTPFNTTNSGAKYFC